MSGDLAKEHLGEEGRTPPHRPKPYKAVAFVVIALPKFLEVRAVLYVSCDSIGCPCKIAFQGLNGFKASKYFAHMQTHPPTSLRLLFRNSLPLSLTHRIGSFLASARTGSLHAWQTRLKKPHLDRDRKSPGPEGRAREPKALIKLETTASAAVGVRRYQLPYQDTGRRP